MCSKISHCSLSNEELITPKFALKYLILLLWVVHVTEICYSELHVVMLREKV